MKQLNRYFLLSFMLFIFSNCIAGLPALTTITTSPIAQTGICVGTSVTIAFTIDDDANAGNVFTAQLSHAAGAFTNPVDIGTLNSTTPGSILATIP